MKETCLTFCIKKIREYRKAGYPARIVCKFSPTVHCSVEVFLATSLLYLDWVHMDSYVGVKNRFLQFLLDIIPFRGYVRVINCDVISISRQKEVDYGKQKKSR